MTTPPPHLKKYVELFEQQLSEVDRLQQIILKGHLVVENALWPAPGSEDTELGVLMELEVGHGATEVYAGVQA